ncbi:exosortase N [Pontibacter qinzhouensis]|uniref:Exosortase N n=1 Tax=Pontibacter qinzhouensis TaxID=2603253 RepID=A0A5C8KBJ5_9BACT|nr:exosortase N [Pontibacter qinzhouensis]TXK52640.1 exosortase N [Pontibacter qinzhouensis]
MQLKNLPQSVLGHGAAGAVLIAAYLLLAFLFLKKYLLWDMPWLLALGLLPLVMQQNEGQQVSWVAGILSFALAGLAAYTQAGTVYYFAWVLALWWSLGSWRGQVGLYPLLVLLLGSPIFSYVAQVLSFPLRLQLTEAATNLLQLVHLPAEAAGNIIVLEGQEFSVDPACAGLSMLAVSLLLAVFVLAHLQKKTGRRLPALLALLLLGFMLLLNLVSNLLRILLLVLFRILPDNPLHDTMGLLCLLLYAVLPYYLVASRCQSRFAILDKKLPKTLRKAYSIRIIACVNSCLVLSLLAAGIQVGKKPLAEKNASLQAFTGFTEEALPGGVQKFVNQEALVYVKPIRAFYATEHHPLICWEGSGYLFRKVRQVQVGTRTLFVGELHQAEEKLYTAWWMDNGRHQTVDQWDWRWRMVRGEAAFAMVNITVAQEQQLLPLAEQLLQKSRP